MIDQRWLILVVLFVARSSFGYQFQSVASSAPSIEAELHIGYAAIGTLIGLYTLPGTFLSLPGGVLGARFGDRTVCMTGLLLMIGGGLPCVVSVDHLPHPFGLQSRRTMPKRSPRKPLAAGGPAAQVDQASTDTAGR